MKRKGDWKATMGMGVIAALSLGIYHNDACESAPQVLAGAHPSIAAWAEAHRPYGDQELLRVRSLGAWARGSKYEVTLPRSTLEVYTSPRGRVVTVYNADPRFRVWEAKQKHGM